MQYLLAAVLIGVVSAIPLVLMGRRVLAMGVGSMLMLVSWAVLYGDAVGFAGPMFGPILVMLAFGSLIGCGVGISTNDGYGRHDRRPTLAPIAVPVLLWFAVFFISFMSSEFLNTDDYRNLVGTMEKRVWTQDIQPKDQYHVRLVSRGNALYLARKQVGELGTIGSQFEVRDDSITLQAIKDELWYVIPLDFAGWRAWNNQGTAVGYIMVHAEDPNRQPIVKQLEKKDQFVYTPGAWFNSDLIRHLRLDGNMNNVLRGTHLEIDEDGAPHWVTAVLKPTIGQFGNKVQGVLITDPVTGVSKFAALGEVPEWVDRVMPADLLVDYIDYWGEYVHGWMNSWWGKRDLTEPEKPSIIYSSEHAPTFVTGVTSSNTKDDSLVGIIYTSTRTGISVYYEVRGGATDEAVSKAVAKFQDVQFKHLHPADPQLYNIYGKMASIVPLVNENQAYSGVAITDIANVQQVAVGRNLQEALRSFQRLIGQTGDFAGIEKEHMLESIEGVVSRVKQDLTTNGSMYLLVIEGKANVFVGASSEFPLLPLVQSGDKVRVEFVKSGEMILPMHSFENRTLVLDRSSKEAATDKRKEGSRDANEAKPVARDLSDRVKNASPEDLRKIEKALKEK